MGWPGRGAGAWYTGRGPVCGVITRRIGACGSGAGGRTRSAARALSTGGAACTGGGGMLGGTAAGGLAEGEGAAGDFAGTVYTGRGPGAGGVIKRRAGSVAAGGAAVSTAGGAAGTAAAGGAAAAGAAGLAAGGAAGLAGADGAAFSACFCWMAFSTSPGFEILERSIFGLISSAAG